jgi:hypothetical protein
MDAHGATPSTGGASTAAARRDPAPPPPPRGDDLNLDALLDDVANAVSVKASMRARAVTVGGGGGGGRRAAAHESARARHRALDNVSPSSLPPLSPPQVNDYVADGFDAFDT